MIVCSFEPTLPVILSLGLEFILGDWPLAIESGPSVSMPSCFMPCVVARPKSPILMWPRESRNRFTGLRSW